MKHPIARPYVGLCILLPSVDDEPPRDSDLWRGFLEEARGYFNAQQLRKLAANFRRLADDIEGT